MILVSVECLFVRGNGKTERRQVERDLVGSGVVRLVRPRHLTVTVDGYSDPVALYDEFRRRGETFDGTPIFCQQGLDVHTATMTALCTLRDDDIAHTDRLLSSECRRFVELRHPWKIDIGESCGDDSHLPDAQRKELWHQGLTRRRAVVCIVGVEHTR